MDATEHKNYAERIHRYMEKALHEAKVHTSWMNPNSEYDQAVQRFVTCVLDSSPDNPFMQAFHEFHGPIARAGMWNSISHTALKITSPGVPDFYQGNELWCFNLVDPDNRRPVDFESRCELLAKLRGQAGSNPAAVVDRLVANPCDGAIKLYITSRALQLRKSHRELFERGRYTPLSAVGNCNNHVVGFARSLAGKTIITLAGRLFLRMLNAHPAPVADAWSNTAILLPREIELQALRDAFTGETISVEQHNGDRVVSLAKAFAHCPAALLASTEGNGR
jgi:(1->4)-alpha-D-glucan 1-alpha-D-glucosylmutase